MWENIEKRRATPEPNPTLLQSGKSGTPGFKSDSGRREEVKSVPLFGELVQVARFTVEQNHAAS